MRDKSAFWAAAANAALAVVQLLLFLPDVAAGRAVDAGPYRIDGLAIVIGVTWSLGAALAVWQRDPRIGWASLLMSAAALNMAYARDPLLFYAGGELLWVGLWLAARLLSGKPLQTSAWTLHLTGWPFLTALLLGLVPVFAPPFAGEAPPWPLFVSIILGFTLLMRGAVWPLDGWSERLRAVTAGRITPLLALYSTWSILLLAKALISAPWEPLGQWALVLLGTVGLLGTLWTLLRGGQEKNALTPALVSTAVIGFGLAPASPLAALGAISLFLVALIGVSLFRDTGWGRALIFVAILPGLWLVTQVAFSQGYLLSALLLLPALTLAAISPILHTPNTIPNLIPSLPAASILITAAIYPQALYWLALRPAVGALAGGVPAPLQFSVDWSVGLRIEGIGGIVVAALPATAIAASLFLVWSVLYWLRRIASRYTQHTAERDVEQNAL